MRREVCIPVLLLVCQLASCGTPTPNPTPTPGRVEGMINPGDTVDGMVFTATDEIDWDISPRFLCDMESMVQSGTTWMSGRSTLRNSTRGCYLTRPSKGPDASSWRRRRRQDDMNTGDHE